MQISHLSQSQSQTCPNSVYAYYPVIIIVSLIDWSLKELI